MLYHPTSLLVGSSVKIVTVPLSILTVPFLVLILLLTVTHSFAASPAETSGNPAEQTAAEQDWVPASTFQNPEIPLYCEGSYIASEDFQHNPDSDILASANEALIIEDKFTTLDGNVEITRLDRQLTATHFTLNNKTETATAEGPVTIRGVGLFIKADHARGNLLAGTGVMDNATFLLHQQHLRGTADHLAKLDDTTLEIKSGTITRCEPGSSFWQLRSDNITLHTDDGNGIARNVTVEIKEIPIAYFPYLRFPLNDKRHSGFLTPVVEYDRDSGTDFSIPWYFNIAPNYDATYTFRNLQKRGLVHDMEFRHRNANSSNFFNLAYLHKDDIYDDRDTFDLSTGGKLTEQKKKDRWLLYLDHKGEWGRWESKVSYGTVSDIDYLNDIGGDIDATSQQRSGSFRSSDKTDTPALHRTGTLSYRGDHWNANLLVRGYQSLAQNAAKQYSVLPKFTVSTRRSLAFLDVQFLGQYANFDKDNEDITGILATVGERLIVESHIQTSLTHSWGYITPSMGVIHQQYELNDAPADVSTSPGVTTPFASIDSGLIFDRFFTYRGSELQQTLEPRLYLLYVKANAEDQNDLPQFDTTESTRGYSRMFRRNRFSGYDRIGDARQLSIGLSSALFDAGTGEEYIKASIGQIVYLKDYEVVFSPGESAAPEAGSSPLFAEARIRIGPGLSLNSLLEWETSESRINRTQYSLKYRGQGNRKILNLTYAYTNPDVQQPYLSPRNEAESDVSFIWPIARKWNIIGRWNFGWDNDQTIESLSGIEYNDCCWKVRIAYRRFLEEPRRISLIVDDPFTPGKTMVVNEIDHRTDSGFFLEFQLKGLSSLGRRLDSLMEDAIPGYRAEE